MSGIRILLIDDDPFVRDALGQLLESEGYEVARAESCGAAMAELASGGDLDVILTDLKLPDGDGLAILNAARDLRPNIPVLVFSGVGTLRHAVEAMKAGALDFLSKPVDPDALLAIVRRAVEHHGLVEEVRRLRAEVDSAARPQIVGSSRALRDVVSLARRAAASDARVLLRGESGTGKELLAFEIHRASRRANRPFVRVNCGAVAESLFESEMFGHKKGAFTGATEDRPGHFAAAHGGSLVFDEVGTLSEDSQAKLLRVLETGEYVVVGDSRMRRADVRTIAITNEDLAARVKAGTFREDLFFRLNVVPIVVPPLRDRMEDLPELTNYILGQIARRDAGPRRRLGAGALEVLARHDWPGNIRELRNVLEHATILTEGPEIRSETLAGILEGGIIVGIGGLADTPPDSPSKSETALHTPEPTSGPSISISIAGDLTLRQRTEDFQRELIREALHRSAGRRIDCARMLGIDPRNLAYYLRKHGFLES
jgi:DNA-binding NtrC family response regulator